MTARESFPEGALTLEQWQRLQELSQTLTPAQASWVSGYFAGFDAGRRTSTVVPSEPTANAVGHSSRTLTILFGTETGNCRDLANVLAASARDSGLSPELFDMADYKPRRLKDEEDLLIIVSTYGEGDPPQPALDFFEFVEGRKAPRLDRVRFAILALGDSTYERYCEAGKRLDRRMEELGAVRLLERVDCDIDYDDPAERWRASIISGLASEIAGSSPSPTGGAAPAPQPSPSYTKRNPFQAEVIENIPIVGRGSSKETRHIEIDLGGSGLRHIPGDALGVVAANDPQIVHAVLEATRIDANEPFSVNGEMMTFGEALERNFEITTSTPRFLEHWARLTDATLLKQLCEEGRAAERMAFLHGQHVVDIIRDYPIDGLDPATLVAGLRPLQPRLYSIASSFSAIPDEVHITLAPVRYILNGQARCGVASAHLADRAEPGTTLPVYVQSNPHFRLPADDVPIVMIGAGTGIAPYRAFLQERELLGAGGRSWLFFGERNFRSDFLYQTEWQTFLKDGTLTRMDVAFSRDTASKIYVQHRILEQAQDLFAWLEDGAHVYVCGDASNMAPDVHRALISVVSDEGRMSREAAEAYLRSLERDHRYQRDVY